MQRKAPKEVGSLGGIADLFKSPEKPKMGPSMFAAEMFAKAKQREGRVVKTPPKRVFEEIPEEQLTPQEKKAAEEAKRREAYRKAIAGDEEEEEQKEQEKQKTPTAEYGFGRRMTRAEQKRLREEAEQAKAEGYYFREQPQVDYAAVEKGQGKVFKGETAAEKAARVKKEEVKREAKIVKHRTPEEEEALRKLIDRNVWHRHNKKVEDCPEPSIHIKVEPDTRVYCWEPPYHEVGGKKVYETNEQARARIQQQKAAAERLAQMQKGAQAKVKKTTTKYSEDTWETD